MSIEHFGLLSSVHERREHESQKPCARWQDADRVEISVLRSCHGFWCSDGSILPVVRAPCPLESQLPDCRWTLHSNEPDRLGKRLRRFPKNQAQTQDRVVKAASRALRKIHAKTRALFGARAGKQLNDEYCAFRAAPCSAPRPSS